MFFGKLFGKRGKEEISSDFSIPQSRNLVLFGCSPPKRTSLWQALCGVEKEAEEKRFSHLDASVKFKRRELEVASDSIAVLNIWGMTGRESTRRVLHPYCRGAHGVVLSFDITDDNSFRCMKTTIESIGELLSGLSAPVYIVEVSEDKKEK